MRNVSSDNQNLSSEYFKPGSKEHSCIISKIIEKVSDLLISCCESGQFFHSTELFPGKFPIP